MTPEDIAETVYIRLSETDDRGEHIRIIAGVVREAHRQAAEIIRRRAGYALVHVGGKRCSREIERLADDVAALSRPEPPKE